MNQKSMLRRLFGAICLVSVVAAAWLATGTLQSMYAARAHLLLHPLNLQTYQRANRELGRMPTRRVVMFGDSRIDKWQPRPDASDIQWVWRGISGETTAQMMFRYSADVIALEPDVVVIQAGINDLVAGVAVRQADSAVASAIDNITAMATQATQSGHRVIILTIVRPARPPLWRWLFWSGSMPALVDDINRALRAMNQPGISVLDADRLLADGHRYLPRDYAADTLHFTPAAYIKLNAAISSAVSQ